MIILGFPVTIHSTATSFYLSFRPSSLETQYGHLESYLFDQRSNIGYKIKGVVETLEIVCSGDHGSVLGYREEAGKILPVLKEESNQAVLDWGYRKVTETIAFFADTLLLDSQLLNPWADVRNATLKIFQAFWLTPTSSEARAWGSFMMEDGWGRGAQMLRVANKYQWKHVVWVLRNRRLQLRKHWWSGGSLVLTPPVLRLVFKAIISVGEAIVIFKPKLIKRIKYLRLKYLNK